MRCALCFCAPSRKWSRVDLFVGVDVTSPIVHSLSLFENEIMCVTSAALHPRMVMNHYHAHLTILGYKSGEMIKSAAPSAGDQCSKTAEFQKNQGCFKTSEKPLRGGARQVLSDWDSHIDQLYTGNEPEDASDTFNARKVHVPFVDTVC